MRLYWKDEIWNVGKELNIPYFNQFKNYWDIENNQGALEISKVINDEFLLKLTKEKPLKYGLILGGFQGKYYTATDDGKIEFIDSSTHVKKSLDKTLKDYGDKAYALLQALINKGGKATYFEIIDEIEKILGTSYVPSYLLPRLQPLKLVFKTGSNKYPDWTIPPEIIPIVKEELNSYKNERFGKKFKSVELKEDFSPKEEISAQVLQSDHKISMIAEKIVQKRREINLIFNAKFGSKLFQENEMGILDIRRLCANEEEFNNRIQSLTTLIDEIEIEGLNKYMDNALVGSINILEVFLKKRALDYDEDIIKNLRNIITLRSKKYPIHRDDPRFIEALEYFSFQNFPPDWGELWEVVLNKYLDSLVLLKESLDKMKNSNHK